MRKKKSKRNVVVSSAIVSDVAPTLVEHARTKRLIIEWPEPMPRYFLISSRMFESMINEINMARVVDHAAIEAHVVEERNPRWAFAGDTQP